jgi:anti-sigma regulatory factor (Ser/Thr protein kinase)
MFAAWVRETTGSYSGTLSVFVGLFALALVVSFLIRLDVPRPRTETQRPAKPSPEALEETEERAFPAKIAVLAEVMDFVDAHARKANLPTARVLNVQLAVEEAVTIICLLAYAEEAAVNLVSYSYRATGGFVIRIRHEKSTLEIDLIDQGPAFNPLLAAPLDLKSVWEDPKARGTGIHLMQRMTDELRYRRVEHKNVLTLVMRKGEGMIDKGK